MFPYSYNILLSTIICLIISSFCQGNEAPLLLFSTMHDIRLVNSTRAYKPDIIIKNTKNLTSYIATIDYHYLLKKIFWADHENESIFSIDYHSKGNVTNKVAIVTDILTPDGLACDWVTNKLYWTDSEANNIEVATIEGKYRKVLFWTDIDQPRAIALVPSEGFMFWTDWGELPKIERASLDGNPNSRKIVISDNIFWPNGLTVDYKTSSVYWADGKLKFIKRMDYDGKNLISILDKGSDYPFALAQFETKLYWTDWKTGGIHYYDTSSQQKQLLEILPVQHPMDIHVYDHRHQPDIISPCQIDNGGCSHLCLLSQYMSKFTCACPMGFKLIDNKTCYDKPQELLLLAKRPEIRLIYLDSPEYSSKALPLNVNYSIAIDFDPVENYIYWSDDEVRNIQKAKIDGTDQQNVIFTEIQHPDGIALDWIARNIYWTDAGTDRIEVSTLTGGYRKVIIMDKLHDPRGIAVAPELGWLFWSDWNEKEPKIERSDLDGSERIQIVSKDLGWPNGITLDIHKTRIYWGDAKSDKIEYAKMDGTNRRELINDNVPHVFGFTLMGDYIYWTDWQRRAIDRANKETGSDREVIVDQMENVMGLKAINLNGATGSNLCKENNGNCSQLCLYKHNREKICTCQIDHELKMDGQTCVKPKAFLLYSKKTNIGRIGIENENYEATIPIAGIKHASAVDFDTNTMRIYWSDSKLRTIMRAFFNGSDIQRVIDLGLTSPEDIAVDWLGLNIYWTDPVSHRIEVSRLMGRSRRTLLWNEAYEPHSIVVDPGEGYIYWSEWGSVNSIKKAAMDGKNQSKLISTVNAANSLTLDYEKKRLYWIEKDTPAIMSSDLNGNDQRVVIRDMFEPVGLTLYRDFIYWSDNKTGEVFRANKTDGSNKVLNHKLEGVTDLLVHYQLKTKNTNQCATSNGGCTHLCLALPPKVAEEQPGYTCACPNHYTLNQKECIPPSSFMIYSLRNLVVRLVPDTSDCPEAVLPIQAMKAVKAIDYDQRTNYLYWIDSKARAIKKSEATEQRMEIGKPKTDTNVVSSHKEIQPFDIALDPVGRLLFWTCEINDVINVTYLENQNSFGNLEKREGEKPRLIALHVDKRLLFYTDIGKTPQLVRVRLNGSHRIVITKAANITAIAVDTENDLVVWAQGHGIYISNIDGENQHVVLNESNSIITQLAVHLGFLYWIDKELDQLQRIEILSGKSRSTLPIQASHILDLISVKNYTENLCSKSMHKCSHFCIHNSSSLICACPHGKILNDDKRTCLVPPHCGDDRFTCNMPEKDKTECIPIAWKCDRQKDCGDGSDEADCPKCLPDQFRCLNGQCIDKKNYCDSYPQCSDKSDEKNCCENGFQCPQTEVCLPSSLVCDGNENCADGSDEKDCRTSAKPPIPTVIVVVLVSILVFVSVLVMVLRKRRSIKDEDSNEQIAESLNPLHPNAAGNLKYRKGIPDIVRMSMLNDSGCPSSFDRRHVTGASSSSNTNGSSVTGYPCETLNPPPSPATTAASTRGSSPSRYRPYRHYRAINQPPPPTPCSTDINDESDYNYPLRGRYDGGPFPPPPTPRSVCHQESCPPSPSSRSSTYFSPLPPPPSPVASPRGGYDS